MQQKTFGYYIDTVFYDLSELLCKGAYLTLASILLAIPIIAYLFYAIELYYMVEKFISPMSAGELLIEICIVVLYIGSALTLSILPVAYLRYKKQASVYTPPPWSNAKDI